MFEGKLIKSVKNQICCKTRFKEGNIKIDVVPVRQQQNGIHGVPCKQERSYKHIF